MSECKFCEALTNWKQVEEFDKAHPEFRITKERIYREYNVALVIRSWAKGKKGNRRKDYGLPSHGHRLQVELLP